MAERETERETEREAEREAEREIGWMGMVSSEVDTEVGREVGCERCWAETWLSPSRSAWFSRRSSPTWASTSWSLCSIADSRRENIVENSIPLPQDSSTSPIPFLVRKPCYQRFMIVEL
jgi:hypothetical protein